MRRIEVRLNEVLRSRGITQTELMRISGVRQASISELANNMRTAINREHLEKIADALEIDDINELITIVSDSDKRGMNVFD